MARFLNKSSIESTKNLDILKQQISIATAKYVVKKSVNDSDVNSAADAVITIVKAPEKSK